MIPTVSGSEKRWRVNRFNNTAASPVVTLPGDALTRVQVQEPTKCRMMRIMMNRIVIVLGMLIASLVMFGAAGKLTLSIGPTTENALAADQELARAMRDNDITGIVRLLFSLSTIKK